VPRVRRRKGLAVHRNQVPYSLDIFRFADFLGRIQLLLIQIHVAAQGDDAIVNRGLHVVEFFLACELL
jgi:hypothetical protein